jgi:DNA invertase Pin-like site-specific DNA recombinase
MVRLLPNCRIEIGMDKAVLYFRESSKDSKHGMDGQEYFVESFLAIRPMTIARIYREIKSGRKRNRPEFKKAVRYAKRIGAILVISTMDRLTRDALIVPYLYFSGVRFIAADKPDATMLDHFEDAIRAQREVELLSKRTKAGLQAAKAKGIELGKNGKVLAAINKRLADDFAQAKGPMIGQLHDEGLSYQGIADKWNKERVSSFHEGCKWHASTVYTTWKRSTMIKS